MAHGDEGEEAVVGFWLAIATATVVTVVVYLICQALWIGQDTVLSLTVLRLVAVASASVCIFSLVGLVLPAPCIMIPLQVISLGILIWRILDIDISDAVLTAIAIWGVWVGLWIGIAAWRAGNL